MAENRFKLTCHDEWNKTTEMSSKYYFSIEIKWPTKFVENSIKYLNYLQLKIKNLKRFNVNFNENSYF